MWHFFIFSNRTYTLYEFWSIYFPGKHLRGPTAAIYAVSSANDETKYMFSHKKNSLFCFANVKTRCTLAEGHGSVGKIAERHAKHAVLSGAFFVRDTDDNLDVTRTQPGGRCPSRVHNNPPKPRLRHKAMVDFTIIRICLTVNKVKV